MADILLHGKIFRAPERKLSKAGKTYAIATLREGQGDAAAWWKVLAFGTAADDLAALSDGDAVAVAGLLKVEPYEKGGETKIGFSVLADRVISNRSKKKKPEKSEERPPARGSSSSLVDDEIPF